MEFGFDPLTSEELIPKKKKEVEQILVALDEKQQ